MDGALVEVHVPSIRFVNDVTAVGGVPAQAAGEDFTQLMVALGVDGPFVAMVPARITRLPCRLPGR